MTGKSGLITMFAEQICDGDAAVATSQLVEALALEVVTYTSPHKLDEARALVLEQVGSVFDIVRKCAEEVRAEARKEAN